MMKAEGRINGEIVRGWKLVRLLGNIVFWGVSWTSLDWTEIVKQVRLRRAHLVKS